MRSVRLILIAAAVIVLGASAAAYAVVGRQVFAANRTPGAVETTVARRLVRLSIPGAARRQRNPFGTDANSWREGADRFSTECALCHGDDGRARGGLAHAMYPPVSDLTDPAIRDLTDGELFALVQNGVRWTGMPAFSPELSADDTWKVIAFVRHLQEDSLNSR